VIELTYQEPRESTLPLDPRALRNRYSQVTKPERLYLATFVLKASDEARGSFSLNFIAGQTGFMLDSFGREMDIRITGDSTVVVR